MAETPSAWTLSLTVLRTFLAVAIPLALSWLLLGLLLRSLLELFLIGWGLPG